ncbi:fimbrial protein [Franconibacter helveticus]|uniref:fimbrial protein n=1 Tax=Franconibacter helveticus TaxID=357240 RepID=UPI000DA2257E|nr:fimbrial protein [Franconibacter helveticus]
MTLMAGKKFKGTSEMKKRVLAIALCGLFIANAAQAVDVTRSLTIVGKVTKKLRSANADCSVELEHSQLDLGRHYLPSLPLQSVTVPKSNILYPNSARLVGSCTNASGGAMAIKFMGTADSNFGNAFVNASTSNTAAKGVGVRVYSTNRTIIKPNVDTVPALNQKYPFYVAMIQLRGAAAPTAGSVQTSITVQVERL